MISSPEELRWGQVWPSRDEFFNMAASRRAIPAMEKVLVDDAAPLGIYRRLTEGDGTFILESAERDGTWNRWSFVGVRSLAHLIAIGGEARWEGETPEDLSFSGSATSMLTDAVDQLRTSAFAGLPSLTGGSVGVFGWDTLYDRKPTLSRTASRELDGPDAAMCLATDMVAVNHHKGEVWLISNAINTSNWAEGGAEVYDRAVGCPRQMERDLTDPVPLFAVGLDSGGPDEPTMRISQEDFEKAVLAGKEAVHDGEAFQVVLSQRADIECEADPLDVYRVLRTVNPSPHMYFLKLSGGAGGSFSVVGSSPETLMRVSQSRITMFPIAGSRPRGATVSENEAYERELLADPKERAEHVMLVDLGHNDLAKVRVPGTVEVEAFMKVKRYSHIMYTSSIVSGRIDEEKTSVDCLAAVFPAGTLSGAPKPRAIELIDRLEPARRGLYGGVVGYFDFPGNADLMIAIRAAVVHAGRASIQAGVGIVADSVPQTEYVKTRNKAAVAVRAVQIASRLQAVGQDMGGKSGST